MDKLNVVVVAHHSRLEQATRLSKQVNGRCVVDWKCNGALYGHIQALSMSCELPGRTIVMEDDAQPVGGFLGLARGWIDRFPDDLISFYLGTGRPRQWQQIISAEIHKPGDNIRLNELVHGVCYSIPVGMTESVLRSMPNDMPADFSIGAAWRKVSGRKVIYPKLSLVDHADGESVERHRDGEARTEVRKARALAGPIA